MMESSKNFVVVLFVLSTTLILGSTIDAYAVDPDGRGDSGVGEIEACLNLGQPPNFFPCDTSVEWDGGNITNEAGYIEGSSIPMRVDITGLETTAPWHQLEIEWDITKTQNNAVKHTFDYITSFDRNDEPHPCLVAIPGEVCETWFSASKEIPPPMANTTNGIIGGSEQPITSFNLLKSLNQTKFWMFAPNATITINDIGYVSEGDPSDAGYVLVPRATMNSGAKAMPAMAGQSQARLADDVVSGAGGSDAISVMSRPL